MQTNLDYTFKLNLFQKPVTLRIGERALHVLDENQQQKRQIDYGQIRKFQEYDGFNGTDPQTGPYQVKFCKLFAKGQRSISLRNGSFVGANNKIGETATSQDGEYRAFLSELQLRVAHANPRATIQFGNLPASVAWMAVSVIGGLVLVMGIAGFFMDEFATAIYLALFCFPAGGLLAYLGAIMSRNYWPRTMNLAKQVDDPID